MAIAKKPNRITSAAQGTDPEKAAEVFISKAGAPAMAPEAQETRKTPVMIRFDRGLLDRVDTAAKRRGISRSAWIQFTVSRALDSGEG
jgi:hypothetical protein